MSLEEAEKHPAGAGRNEPDPLEKPKYVLSKHREGVIADNSLKRDQNKLLITNTVCRTLGRS
jgi:hypothetical protein